MSKTKFRNICEIKKPFNFPTHTRNRKNKNYYQKIMKPSKTQDLYERLGIIVNASPEKIKRAFKQAVLKYHPDRNPNNKEEATKKFNVISKSYEILSDPTKRTQYDIKRKFESNTKRDNTLFGCFKKTLKKSYCKN